METNHTQTCSQRIWAEALFMTADLNSQKKKTREEGGWKRIAHQRQWHAQSAYRSKHARQHCSFSTELRNITWKVHVPGKGITHSSETWGTCLQGYDVRELVADSPLGFLSELKFYFTFPTLHAWFSLELKPSKVYNLLDFSFACNFLLASFPVLLIFALFLESGSQIWGKVTNQAIIFQFWPVPDTELANCVLTCARIWSPRAGDWRCLLLITTLKVFLSPVFFLSPRSDTQKIQGISRT